MDCSGEYVNSTNCDSVENWNDRIRKIKQYTDNKITKKMEDQIKRSEAQEIRIIILGSVQSGKSKLANRLLDSTEFTSQLSSTPVTKSNQTAVKFRYGWGLKVTDTPGIDDLTRTDEDIAESLADLVVRNQPGPHIFLLVIPIGPCYPLLKNVIWKLPEIFGDGMLKHTIVVFTYSDKLSSEKITIEQFLGRDFELNNFVKKCNDYISTDNLSDEVTDIQHLIEKIDSLVLHNNEAYYHNGLFQLPAEVLEEDRKNKERQMETVEASKLKKLKEIANKLFPDSNHLTMENDSKVDKLSPNNGQLHLCRQNKRPYDKIMKK